MEGEGVLTCTGLHPRCGCAVNHCHHHTFATVARLGWDASGSSSWSAQLLVPADGFRSWCTCKRNSWESMHSCIGRRCMCSEYCAGRTLTAQQQRLPEDKAQMCLSAAECWDLILAAPRLGTRSWRHHGAIMESMPSPICECSVQCSVQRVAQCAA